MANNRQNLRASLDLNVIRDLQGILPRETKIGFSQAHGSKIMSLFWKIKNLSKPEKSSN